MSGIKLTTEDWLKYNIENFGCYTFSEAFANSMVKQYQNKIDEMDKNLLAISPYYRNQRKRYQEIIDGYKPYLKNIPDENLLEKYRIKSTRCIFKEEYDKIGSKIYDIMYQSDKSKDKAIKDLFEIPYTVYKKTFEEFSSFLSSQQDMRMFVFVEICENHNDLQKVTLKQIEDIVLKYVSNSISDENYCFLKEIGYSFYDVDITPQNDSLVHYWARKIVKAVIAYMRKCESEYVSFSQYEEEYKQSQKEKLMVIDEFQKSLEELSWYKVIKQFQLKQSIKKAKNDLSLFEKQMDYEGKRQEFEKNYI